MIGFLEGLLVSKQAPHLLLNVNGVGYEVEAPMTVFYDLPDSGQKILLHTHLQVREDAHKLYGFATTRQRDLFRTLLKISGVGPRVGLAILSGLTAEQFERCISDGDMTQLTRVPGIGCKTAERVRIEVRDRLEDLGPVDSGAVSVPAENAEHDALGALLALGYKSAEASKAIRSVRQPGMTSEALIRGALAGLARVNTT